MEISVLTSLCIWQAGQELCSDPLKFTGWALEVATAMTAIISLALDISYTGCLQPLLLAPVVTVEYYPHKVRRRSSETSVRNLPDSTAYLNGAKGAYLCCSF
jgi:hypothetical protein